ncbi:transcriptional repressor [Rhodococcus sp. 15-725-2-2b]|uniref:Fur family transcriptional regulator n=1 Tax=unclassified Rhodococcus (in: high G+C Gram-positive bacteria) TaxID=192944 RepID=UPI000B9A2FD0|nr:MULTISPECIES: Fur family transcriptional regulator [unclassified Rhodococcus (in: high G+C Gram-positive bacteria)]OZC64786.1 transcriptional repressor [Rhodococcus sp. 06-469-3-2]OZC70113.1 transcriptional repressor [Rhodococcus sp. 06-470-2]OZD43616.1 transcriptional repressor [Rhodococcus sp. 06-1477-1A]OZE13579.1 transcriptional repressor [Rhodococcus sp. 05-2255-3C]OZE15803.1 transcriptional repressor [Rhodococcus sp. 05-2255-3B1]
MTDKSTDTATSRRPVVVGVRATKQRSAISDLLDTIEEFKSAQDLHDELRKRGEGIGLTTVYRTLQTLADAGTVDVLRTDNGESVYRRCSSGHHHHLVCRSCGFTVEVEGPTVEKWSQSVAESNGFSDVSHTIEIFGTCSQCTAAPQ